MKRALEMFCARKRPHSMGIRVSSLQWMTIVGTRIDERMSLTSVSAHIRNTAVTAAGLAPKRSKRPHQCCMAASVRRDGANDDKLRPFPQARSIYLKSGSRTSAGTGKRAQAPYSTACWQTRRRALRPMKMGLLLRRGAMMLCLAKRYDRQSSTACDLVVCEER
jgi:hypothetical protein